MPVKARRDRLSFIRESVAARGLRCISVPAYNAAWPSTLREMMNDEVKRKRKTGFSLDHPASVSTARAASASYSPHSSFRIHHFLRERLS
jgi:hypothetical protein